MFRLPFLSNSKRLTAEEIKNLLTDHAVLIDVRTPAEYAQSHISGARNMNLNTSDFRQKVSTLDKDRTYLLYCRSGSRSGMAAGIFKELGLEAHNIGGLDDLARNGLKVAR